MNARAVIEKRCKEYGLIVLSLKYHKKSISKPCGATTAGWALDAMNKSKDGIYIDGENLSGMLNELDDYYVQKHSA